MSQEAGDSWQRVVVRGRDTQLISLSLATLGPGDRIGVGTEEERLVVIEEGDVEAVTASGSLGRAGGRHGVFDGPGHGVYLPPGLPASLEAGPAGARMVLASAPCGQGADPRVIGPRDQRIAEVGRGNWSRTVRTILGPEHEAGRLLAGETINPPGNWSSYPPHRHDEDRPPEEVSLEEVYLFRVDRPEGFGVQLRYREGEEEAFIVRDGDTAAITRGFHPVVAAPGYRLAYLWVMAGSGRHLRPYLDPDHAWVQEG